MSNTETATAVTSFSKALMLGAGAVITGNAVFPLAVDPKFASEKPHMQRMHTCAAQWQANKANNTTGGMHWNQKGGGGYYSVCNQRLKGEA